MIAPPTTDEEPFLELPAPVTAVVVAVIVVVFAIALAIAGFPETWETAFAAACAAVTTIMVFTIQHTQSREQAATQLNLKAEYTDGVLVLRIPVREQAKARKIPIASGQSRSGTVIDATSQSEPDAVGAGHP